MELVENREEMDRGIRLMIFQLEKKNVDHFLARLNSTDKSYVNLQMLNQMLKLKIENITGKKKG